MIALYLPGGIPVYTFAILIGLGSALGLAWTAWRAPEADALARVNGGIWALVGALVGGRAAFIAAHWSYYQVHLAESWQVASGGLSWPGAAAGGLLFLALYAGLARRSLAQMADGLLPLLACLTVSAWLAGWLDGSAYGIETTAAWGMPARDLSGTIALRRPVQFLGALLALALFWLIDRFGPARDDRRSPAGRAAGLALLGLSLQMLAISFLRADPAPSWQGLRLESWAAMGFVLLGAGWLLAALLKPGRSHSAGR